MLHSLAYAIFLKGEENAFTHSYEFMGIVKTQ